MLGEQATQWCRGEACLAVHLVETELGLVAGCRPQHRITFEQIVHLLLDIRNRPEIRFPDVGEDVVFAEGTVACDQSH